MRWTVSRPTHFSFQGVPPAVKPWDPSPRQVFRPDPVKLDPTLAGLVLLAALMHASWNAIVKSDRDRLASFGMVMFAGTVVAAFVAPFVAFPSRSAWPFLAASVVVHNFYYFFLL